MRTPSTAWVLAVATAGCSGPLPGRPVAPPLPPPAGLVVPGVIGATCPPPAGRDATMLVDLPTVLRLARGRNLDAAIVRERVREAYARELSARQRFFPTASVGARFQAHDGRTQSTEGDFLDVTRQSAFAGGAVSLEWELGEAWYASLAARQRSRAACEAAAAGDDRAALLAGEAYLDLVRGEARVQVATEALALAGGIARETEAKAKAGQGFRGDVLRASVQASRERLRLATAREDRDVAEARLAEVLDLPPGTALAPADALPIRLTLVPDDGDEGSQVRAALSTRPDVRAADSLAEAARHESDAARYGPLVPRVSAEAALGGLGEDFGDLSSTEDYRVGLSWRIGAGGLLDAGRVREADSRARSSALETSRVRGRVVREVREAVARVRAGSEAIAAAETGAEQAREALDLFRRRQQAEVGAALEAALAEESLATARRDWIDATIAFDKAQLRLLHAVGGARLRAVETGAWVQGGTR